MDEPRWIEGPPTEPGVYWAEFAGLAPLLIVQAFEDHHAGLVTRAIEGFWPEGDRPILRHHRALPPARPSRGPSG